MKLTELPPEIIREMVKSCESKSTLASLALTHSICCVQAEPVLYERVDFRCVPTLASNQRKAKLVRCLVANDARRATWSEAQSYPKRTDIRWAVALENATSLRVLWLDRGHEDYVKEQEREINATLCKTRYEFLHTFYFKDLDLDLAKIVYNLPNLERLVGGHPNEQRLIKAFKQTRNRSLTTDIPQPHFRMYTFGTFGNSSLGLFAGFHSVSEILQDIHDAFIKPPPGSGEFLWLSKYYNGIRSDSKSLSEIILYLIDTPLKEEVHLIISGLMKIFIPTDLGMLTFIFEHPVETDPEEMKDILSLLPGLVRLNFHRFPSDKAPEHVDSSVREAQAKEYIKMSRRLCKIRFIDDYFYDQSREFFGQWE